MLKEYEKSINDELVLPNLLKIPAFNQKHWNIFLLSISEGDLSILKREGSFKEYELSVELSSPISLSLPEAELTQQQIILEIKKEKELGNKSKKKTRNKSELKKNTIRSLELASEKGALSWWHTIPLKRYIFELANSGFLVALPSVMAGTQ